MDELESAYEYMELHPEVRPAIARVKEPVHDDDGFITHYEVRERVCAVHTLQVGRGGWVCEWEDGSTSMITYENVRFMDGKDR